MAAVMRADEPTLVSTRERLVMAAADVFAEQGYDRTRVQEIARRAGLTTGAIYANFSGKAELLSEAIDMASSPELDRLMGEGRLGGSVADVLIQIGEHLTDDDSDIQGPGSELLFEAFAAARRDPDAGAALCRGIEEIAGKIRAVVEVGKTERSIDPAVDSDAVARLAMSLALGALVFELVGAQRPDRMGWGDLIRRIVGSITVDN